MTVEINQVEEYIINMETETRKRLHKKIKKMEKKRRKELKKIIKKELARVEEELSSLDDDGFEETKKELKGDQRFLQSKLNYYLPMKKKIALYGLRYDCDSGQYVPSF